MLHYYCFAHEPIRFALDPRVVVVEMGPRGASKVEATNQVVHAYDLVEDLAKDHCWLGGSLGSFAVLRHLAQVGASPTDRVCISHYRRFLSPEQHGQDAASEPGIRTISTADCAVLNPYSLAESHALPILTSQPWTGGFGVGLSVRDQYARAHYLEDLDRYIALAVELGIVDQGKVAQYLDAPVFIPGGIEFSMCPVSIYVDIIQKIEKLNRAYLARFETAHRSDYQDRFLCYCNERLGSFFLSEAVLDLDAPEGDCAGYMHIVTPTQAIEPGIWQPQSAAQKTQRILTGRTCVLHVGMPQTGATSLQFALQDYDDGQSISAGHMMPNGYPVNNALIAGALEQHEIDACLDFVDRLGQTDLDTRYHGCAWALNDLRRDLGHHPHRDGIRDGLVAWLSAHSTPRVLFSAPALFNMPSVMGQLSAWLGALFDDVQVIAYVSPPETRFGSALADAVSAVEFSQSRWLWKQPIEGISIGGDRFIAASKAQFGPANVRVVPYDRATLIGHDITHDFCARFDLDIEKAKALNVPHGLSAEATAILATYVAYARADPLPARSFGNRMALHKVLESFGEKVFLLNEAGGGVGNDYVRITTRQDILDFGAEQIESFRQHLASQWSLQLPKSVNSSRVLGQYLDELMRSKLRAKITPVLPQGFDPDRYIWKNRDVALAGISAEKHFLRHGYFEGRQT
ncbi:hypothetical protein [Yoonia sp. I 8.24]|uniref:hypothetical protein n=1 Tax=Yoonia sp. I 8.24 TaxID=1537229 RepID=UPI001EDD50E2|nr:hypothetical protein [Yoonia sp. I 8.24]MCG3267389.1 hypothetical protein [Yoonia sp. I 8.24]